MIDNLTLDKNIINFLCNVYFTKGKDEFEKASSRAYLDLCRTIKFTDTIKKNDVQKEASKNKITEMIKNFTEDLFRNENNLNTQIFNDKHENLCKRIIQEYAKITEPDTFTAGHAQKWVNMTLKYLYILFKCNLTDNKFDYEKIIQYFHIPVDRIILDEGKKLGVIPHTTPHSWSTWSYDTYKSYQADLIAAIKKKDGILAIPIIWELEIWKPTSN